MRFESTIGGTDPINTEMKRTRSLMSEHVSMSQLLEAQTPSIPDDSQQIPEDSQQIPEDSQQTNCSIETHGNFDSQNSDDTLLCDEGVTMVHDATAEVEHCWGMIQELVDHKKFCEEIASGLQ